MATRNRTRPLGTRDPLRDYEGRRPEPDLAPVDPIEAPGAPMSWREEVQTAGALNVIAGIWLIISPFVLGYTAADAAWNPIVFGAIVAFFAFLRFAGAYRAEGLSWLNMAIGAWLFISAFWLAQSMTASWNVGILGVIVFVLGAWGAAASADAQPAIPRR
jgi:hypothetical protein